MASAIKTLADNTAFELFLANYNAILTQIIENAPDSRLLLTDYLTSAVRAITQDVFAAFESLHEGETDFVVLAEIELQILQKWFEWFRTECSSVFEKMLEDLQEDSTSEIASCIFRIKVILQIYHDPRDPHLRGEARHSPIEFFASCHETSEFGEDAGASRMALQSMRTMFGDDFIKVILDACPWFLEDSDE